MNSNQPSLNWKMFVASTTLCITQSWGCTVISAWTEGERCRCDDTALSEFLWKARRVRKRSYRWSWRHGSRLRRFGQIQAGKRRLAHPRGLGLTPRECSSACHWWLAHSDGICRSTRKTCANNDDKFAANGSKSWSRNVSGADRQPMILLPGREIGDDSNTNNRSSSKQLSKHKRAQAAGGLLGGPQKLVVRHKPEKTFSINSPFLLKLAIKYKLHGSGSDGEIKGKQQTRETKPDRLDKSASDTQDEKPSHADKA